MTRADVRILLLESFGEYFVSLDVLRSPLFVADANHLQVERLRVAHLGALASPLGVDGSIGEFDQIDRVLNVVIEIFERREFTGVELAGHAAVQNRQRLGADVFAQQEVFVITETERLVVVRRRAAS